MTQKRSIFIISGLTFISLAVLLSGCLSLAEDITPPPGENPPVQELPATITPDLEPTLTMAPDPTDEPSGEESGSLGTVNVYLVDQTDGNILQEGLEVRLLGFDSFELVVEVTEPVSGSNQVQFTGVEFPPGRIYFANLAYQGTVYQSNLVQVGGDTGSIDLELVVFDTTTDQSALVIDRLHLIL